MLFRDKISVQPSSTVISGYHLLSFQGSFNFKTILQNNVAEGDIQGREIIGPKVSTGLTRNIT